MVRYVIRRLMQGVLVILLVSVLVFLFMRLLPGDPLVLYLAQSQVGNLSSEDMAAYRHQFGLDRSLPIQYMVWIGQVFRGDLGKSIFFNQSVLSLVSERLPITLCYGFVAAIMGSLLGIVFGVICALRRGMWLDTLITLLANIGITLPSFWVGVMLIYLLSFKLGWLPVAGFTSRFESIWVSARQLIMPIFCLALFPLSAIARQTRSSMLEVIRQDCVRTAWAKGLRERIIVGRHIIKNAMIPVVTALGIQVGYIFGGSVIIETVFNIPGVGRLLAVSLFSQDFQVVQAIILVISLVVVLSNLLVDIIYGCLDPRIRYD